MNVTWTNRGEVDTIFDPVSGVTFDYEWTASSLVDSVAVGTDLVRDYSYDTAGRVTADVLSNTTGVVSTMGYGYDKGSNMVTKVVGIPGNPGFGTHTYTYDQADRLESWTFGTETTAYGYDLSGNRTQAGSDVYSFDARNRLITGPEGSYTHTARGTLVSVVGAESHTYDFDSLDRLVAFDAVDYTYDGLDRVATRGTDVFTYSGLGIDPTSDGQFTYGRTPGGNLLSITDGTEMVLVGRDRHGDVTHLYNQTGLIQHSRLYDPFGEVTTTAGTQVGQVGFQGDWTDPASEHVWMGARWYDGGWATFLSRDTVFGELSTSVSLNRYTYANNNPLSFWDPDGRCPDYLGSINGGTALAQCKADQAEMSVKMQAQTSRTSIANKSKWEDVYVRRTVGELQSTNKQPEPASDGLDVPGVGGAVGDAAEVVADSAGRYSDQASEAARNLRNGVPGSGSALAEFRKDVNPFAHRMNKLGRNPALRAAGKLSGPANLLFFGLEVEANYNGRYAGLPEGERMERSFQRAAVTEGTSWVVVLVGGITTAAVCGATAGVGCLVAAGLLVAGSAYGAGEISGMVYDAVTDPSSPAYQKDKRDSWQRIGGG